MPKISSTNNTVMILKYFFKAILTSIITILILNLVVSFAFLKLDLDLKYLKYAGVVIIIFASMLTSFISTLGFKQSYLLISIISIIPLLIFSVLNTIINREDFKILVIKVILSVLTSIIVALIMSTKKRRR